MEYDISKICTKTHNNPTSESEYNYKDIQGGSKNKRNTFDFEYLKDGLLKLIVL